MEIDFLKAVAQEIKPLILPTPTIYSEELSNHYGCNIYLKLENLQFTGAFKIRGNAYKLSRLSLEELKSGVITASSGNHGLGLSLSAQRKGVKSTVVVPERTPANKIEKLNRFGAEVILHGNSYDDAVEEVRRIVDREGYIYVPSFDDRDIITGNATMGLEIYQDVPQVDLVICPIGGGGGISGIGLALESLKPGVRIVGVEAEGAASMLSSLQAGKPCRLPEIFTQAEGIAVSEPGKIPYGIVSEIVEKILLVSEKEMQEALKFLLEKVNIVVELAGAVSTAALAKLPLPSPAGNVVCLVSGGNIDLEKLQEIIG